MNTQGENTMNQKPTKLWIFTFYGYMIPPLVVDTLCEEAGTSDWEEGLTAAMSQVADKFPSVRALAVDSGVEFGAVLYIEGTVGRITEPGFHEHFGELSINEDTVLALRKAAKLIGMKDPDVPRWITVVAR